MATANLFFAVLTLAANVALVTLVVLVIAERVGRPLTVLRRVRPAALFTAAAVAIVATLGSLYYSEIAGLRPCALCWYQRAAMYPLAVLLLIAGIRHRPSWWRRGLPIAGIGVLISAYHYGIQLEPALAIQGACSVEVPCTAVELWELGFMSMAYMAGSAFLLIAALLWFGARKAPPGKAGHADVLGRRDSAVAVGSAMAVAALVAVFAVPATQPPPTPAVDVAAPEVNGEALPQLGEGQDAAVGMSLPQLSGSDYRGQDVSVTDDGRPKIIIVVAHWCPHCQEEVPEVQEWIDNNGLPDDVALFAVSTAAEGDAPNYPPEAWLERERWSVPTIADDEHGTARTALGVSGFPFFVFADADGTVLSRHAGRLGIAAFEAAIQTLRG